MKKLFLLFGLVFSFLCSADFQFVYPKIVGSLVGSSLGSTFGRWHMMTGKRVDGFLQNFDGVITGDQQLANLVLQHAVFAYKHKVKPTNMMRSLAKDFITWSHDSQGGKNSLRFPRSSTMTGCYQLDTMMRLGYHKINNRWWATGTGVSLAKIASLESDIGSALHAIPFGLVFYNDFSKAALFAVEHSLLTHRSKEARGACATIATGIAMILKGHEYHLVIEKMIATASRHSHLLVRAMRAALKEIKENSISEMQFFKRYQGDSAVDVLAVVTYVFAKFHNQMLDGFDIIARYCKDSIAPSMLFGGLSGAYYHEFMADLDGYGNLENFDDIMYAVSLMMDSH